MGASSSAPDTQPAQLTLTLDHEGTSAPYVVVATVQVRTASGAGIAGQDVRVTVFQGTAGAVMDVGGGTYTVRIIPTHPSGEMPVEARLETSGGTLTAARTALLLPFVAQEWLQPEVVRGMVNTAGYEDGASISPDGQWMVLTDYSPVDVVCCLGGCGISVAGDPFGTTCQTSHGPVDGELRPDFPGRDRIMSPTRIINSCPSICFTADQTASGGEEPNIPLFPVGGYVFRRADGSFAEPRFIGFGADGCVTPTGYSFVASPDGATAELVYSWNPPEFAWSGGGYGIYWSSIELGQTNRLGDFTCAGYRQPVVAGADFTRLNITVPQVHTNPVYRGGILMFENDRSTPQRTYFALGTGALPGTTFTPAAEPFERLGMAQASDNQIMPFLDADENTIYWLLNDEIHAAERVGGDVGAAESWSTPVRILAPEHAFTRANQVVAMGQPTVAHVPGGPTEMYFIYALWTGSGVNMQAGMVVRR